MLPFSGGRSSSAASDLLGSAPALRKFTMKGNDISYLRKDETMVPAALLERKTRADLRRQLQRDVQTSLLVAGKAHVHATRPLAPTRDADCTKVGIPVIRDLYRVAESIAQTSQSRYQSVVLLHVSARLPNDRAVQRRTQEGAKRPMRPADCHGLMGSADAVASQNW